MSAGRKYLVHECCNLLTENVIDLQLDERLARNCKLDARRGIERVRIILGQGVHERDSGRAALRNRRGRTKPIQDGRHGLLPRDSRGRVINGLESKTEEENPGVRRRINAPNPCL